MMRIKKVLLSLMLLITFSFLDIDVSACENSSNLDSMLLETKGATDIYYQPIDYSITKTSPKKYDRTITVSTSITLKKFIGPVEVTYQHVVSGDYKVYKYTADFYVRAKMVDAMGHYLGTTSFTRKDISCEEYVPV